MTGTLFKTGGHGIYVSLDMFFDSHRVQAAMDEKSNRVLSSAGAYTRTAMMRGMKRRKGISDVRKFPSAHENPLLKSKIRFGMTKENGELGVVIGPAMLNGSDSDVAAAGLTVPELINFGGTVYRRRVYDKAKKRSRPIRHGQAPVPWLYRPRPFVELTRPVAERKLAENLEKFGWK